eukprot:gene25155-31307_t
MNNVQLIKTLPALALAGLLTVHISNAQNITQQQQPFKGVIGKTLAESKESWTEPVKAPKGSPNVVWILLDDVGFGASSSFGGVINTPTFDSLAANGLRYTNFHTAAI